MNDQSRAIVALGRRWAPRDVRWASSADRAHCRVRGMTRPQVIEITAGEIADELRRRGIGPDERVRLTIEPERELFPGRRESRKLVIAAGLKRRGD